MNTDKYNHTQIEDNIYSYWEKNNLFKPKKNKKKFSIVIPPPNVTGRLHMGHALNNSIQDLLTRFHRMNNFETLWQPGTDHAGIATQALVEKKLETQLSEINTCYSAWFHKGDKNFNLDALFGSAKKIFVTEDSAMMISESISSGKPVSTLYPSKIKSPARYRKHIQKYEDLKYIIRQSIESFSVDFDSDAKNRIEAHHRDLLKIISVKINW